MTYNVGSLYSQSMHEALQITGVVERGDNPYGMRTFALASPIHRARARSRFFTTSW